MNKGFTLTELLAVIAILALVALIAVPSIDRSLKKSRERALDVQLDHIKTSAKNWAMKNLSSLPEENGQRITILLGQLKQEGYLQVDLRNPVSKKLFPNDMVVTIQRVNNNYIYNVDLLSGTEGLDNTINPNAPVIILNGSPYEYCEINDDCKDKGAIAKSSSGEVLTSMITTYQVQDHEVPSLDATTYAVYTVIYTVVDQGITTKAVRNIMIRDTTPPELIVPEDTTISSSVTNFDLSEGVSATDNSKEDISVNITGNLNLGVPGKYKITYVAKDSHNNKVAKIRTITIE